MALKLTPDVLAAAYEYLRATLPFKRWGLPHGSEVRFYIGDWAKSRGEYKFKNPRHQIGVSRRCIVQTGTLIPVMAHEVCHLRQEMLGDRTQHGAVWQRLADQACRHHGFDRALF
jgi:hypothetical protein